MATTTTNTTTTAANTTAANTDSTNPEEIQRRREDLEQTWKAIRTYWLWAHETREERSFAAYSRGAGDLAPLHLICKLTNNPPTDIINEIVRSAPEVASWTDSHMWLPLHHACINGASTEVLKLLIGVYPGGKSSRDAHNRTPLHLYATRGTSDNYTPVTMAANYSLLCSISAAELRDVAGMIPMHYACAYGTATSVLQVLEEAYPQSLNAKDDNGRTPLHFVMVNAQRTASPGVLRFLLGWHDNNNEDHEGNLPLHLLNIGLNGVDFKQNPEKLDSAAECLKLYLAAEPYASTDFLAALQALPELLQDVAVVSPHVRNILNKRIVQRFPTSILMLDGIMLVTMIVCFELATTRFIDKSIGEVSVSLENDDLEYPLAMLYATAAYFFLRELIQVIASLTLGALTSWLYDTTNWLDVLVITLVTYYSIVMTIEEPTGMEDAHYVVAFRTGTALTKGVLWTAVIFFLKSTQVDFAVFLNGVFYVVRRLVAFLLAILVILISFAQMFWVIYLDQPVCKFACDEEDLRCKAEMEGCAYPHCEFRDSFLKVYTMMMGEIGTETRYDQNLVAQIMYIFYGFFIVILLSNVLIAIVTDSYEIVQNDRAAIVFWSNRLDFVAEMDGIASVVRKRIFCWERNATNKAIVPDATHDDQSYETTPPPPPVNVYAANMDGSEEWFREKWHSITCLFEHDVYGVAAEDIRPMDYWIELLKKTLAIIVIPPWLILGFATVGILWPPQVREWLFVQMDSVASRAEIERRKLEQLQEIQQDTKNLRDEIRMEMQNDRDEMFRTKAEVDAVQEEILADLQQVSALVSTLLSDLGGLDG
eukprot:jgi/Psemu1/253683/estExt_Genewise1Plus.C_740119